MIFIFWSLWYEYYMVYSRKLLKMFNRLSWENAFLYNYTVRVLIIDTAVLCRYTVYTDLSQKMINLYTYDVLSLKRAKIHV